MRKCVFCKTRYRKGSKTSFHRFPTELTLRNMWLQNMNAINWTPNTKDYLCSKHFDAKCFVTHNTRTALKLGSVPTLLEGLFEIPDQNVKEELEKATDYKSYSEDNIKEEELQPADFTYEYKYVPDQNVNEEIEEATDNKSYSEEELHPADFIYPYKNATCTPSTSQDKDTSPSSSNCQSSKKCRVKRMLSESMDSSKLGKNIRTEEFSRTQPKTRMEYSVAHDHRYESTRRSGKNSSQKLKRSLKFSNSRVKTLTQQVKRLKIKLTNLKTLYDLR